MYRKKGALRITYTGVKTRIFDYNYRSTTKVIDYIKLDLRIFTITSQGDDMNCFMSLIVGTTY